MRILVLVAAAMTWIAPVTLAQETDAERDARMKWWREARYGMFIHWGIYSVAAGEWQGKPVGGVGEWIMHIGRIPVPEYEPLAQQFNPVNFDADAWARLARDAGMKYLVITTKHHDGFALFPSEVSDYDIEITPFKRDVMKELAEACRRHDVKIGWYHSILDWHHPDYLPKRDWHQMPSEGADYERYVEYLHGQVREILTNYGPIDVMWFDGEWDATWTHEHGLKLEALVRELQPQIVINNRVDKARYPGETAPDGTQYGGDFGTPEQYIPDTGLPGVDWETCMTMNDTWAFKKDDDNWKSTDTLLRNLVDVASKGGNYLLNVGPTPQGEIPPPSVERLLAVGRWLKVNGESIYGTSASPFVHLPWGRCTQRSLDDVTRLYLHVFEWPEDGVLRVPGLANEPRAAALLADGAELQVQRDEDAVVIRVPKSAPDARVSVVQLDIAGTPQVTAPPVFDVDVTKFTDEIDVAFPSADGKQVRYTVNGRRPSARDPLAPARMRFDESTTIRVRYFDGERPLSGDTTLEVERVAPWPTVMMGSLDRGVSYDYFTADLNAVRELKALTPARSGKSSSLDISQRDREEHYGFRFRGMIRVPVDAMYTFTLRSDDGSLLEIDGREVVDNDGLHAAIDKSGAVPLAGGLHSIEVWFFEKGGSEELVLWIEGGGLKKQPVAELLRLDPRR